MPTNFEIQCRKPQLIDGVEVQLGDGNMWMVPRLDRIPKRAVYFNERTEDPRGPALRPWYRRWVTPWNGTVKRFVNRPSAYFVQDDPTIIALAEDARDLAEEALTNDERTVNKVDATNFVFRVLALNYNITVDVVNSARLITEDNLGKIISVFIGLDVGNPIRHAVEVAFRIAGLNLQEYSPTEQIRIAAFFESAGMAPPSALSEAVLQRSNTTTCVEDLIGEDPNG